MASQEANRPRSACLRRTTGAGGALVGARGLNGANSAQRVSSHMSLRRMFSPKRELLSASVQMTIRARATTSGGSASHRLLVRMSCRAALVIAVKARAKLEFARAAS